jgi:hypothetical protein
MEVWKDIKGYEGLYKVSNFGIVKSFYFGKEKILKHGLGTQGYKLVVLCKNKNQKTKFIHQLVAIAFLKHKPCGMKTVVNHIDLNRLNNKLENLELVSQRQNSNQKHIKSSSKYTGVTWCEKRLKWMSRIFYKGKLICLGGFNSEKKASLRYEEALINIRKSCKIKDEVEYSSKYKGVSWHKQRRKWRSTIYFNGESKHIGLFHTEIESHEAYECKLKEFKQVEIKQILNTVK